MKVKRAKKGSKKNKLDKKILKSKKLNTPILSVVAEEQKLEPESLERHDTGISVLDPANAKTKLSRTKLEKEKANFEEGIKTAARAEILNAEGVGFIELEEDDLPSSFLKQYEICEAVDIASASKHFELNLPQFGPYRFDYTPNGRHLLLGGKRGHLAAIDWPTKRLHNETNVMEGIRDIQWLHTEKLYAVAQKRWTHIYDSQGTELHCIKQLHDTKKLEFLPRHFLLVAATNTSFLHWLDVSMGKLVTSFRCPEGPLTSLIKNPANGIVLTGNGKGTVSLWSPNVKEPLVKMLTHKGIVKGLDVDTEGKYLVSTGLDARMRLWDLRMFKQLKEFKFNSNIGEVAMSQRRSIAVATGNVVRVFEDPIIGTPTGNPSLMYTCRGLISSLQFCPFEDVLGVGHEQGFVSLLVPGSGDPNVDALFNNPYESKQQRREREVRMLLEKIPAEMISLNVSNLNRVKKEEVKEEEEDEKNFPQKGTFPKKSQKSRNQPWSALDRFRQMEK